MAKQLRKHIATLLSISPIHTEQDADWSWRLQYVGIRGTMYIMRGERKYSNKIFIVLSSDDKGSIQTSCGTLAENGNIITLTTGQSIYKFKIEA